MTKATSILRLVIILALSLAAFVLLFGEEQSSDLTSWVFRSTIAFIFGILDFLLIVWLCKRWSKTDPWFIAFAKQSEKDICQQN